MPGAVLIAITALAPVETGVFFGGKGYEEGQTPTWRRRLVIAGAGLLVLGFGLQIAANYLQLGQ